MNRREALATLSSIATATGLSVTPVSTRDADDAVLLIVKCKGHISVGTAERLKTTFQELCKGTPLEAVPVVVLDNDIDIELLHRKPKP